MQQRVHKSPRVAFRETQKGGVLLHLDTGQYHEVNGLGALIWSLIDHQSVDEIVAAVGSRFEDAPAELAEDVQSFLHDLTKRNLADFDEG